MTNPTFVKLTVIGVFIAYALVMGESLFRKWRCKP